MPMGETSRRTRLLLATALTAAGLAVFGFGGAQASQEVVGGDPVSTAQYPYAVFLTNRTGFQFCGGTIVGPSTVVTAAHCAAGQSPEALLVVAGRDDKQSEAGVVAEVADVWVDPDYGDVHLGADVAVLTLAVKLPYRPARLNHDPELYQPGTLATVLGWGRTKEGGTTSRYLMGAAVPVVADGTCAKDYQDFAATAMVCAGYPQGGVDTCQGDSGGPMLVGDVLVGISSWGDGCARPGKPGVYTRVTSYAALIEEFL
jgi:trypsin